MNIPVNSPKGIKLLTKGKYVTDDIEVTPVLQDKSVTPTDTVQSVSADDGYAGLGTVKISAIETESGAATPSAAAQTVTPPEGKFFDKFTVNATPTETKTIDANGTFTPSVGKFFSEVTVNVNTAKPEQEKSVTITENGVTEVTPDAGFALSKVTTTVNVDTAKPEQTKAVDIDSMAPVTVTPDAGHVLTEVTVTPKAPLAATGDATAAAGDILTGKTAYVNGAKVTGTIELADAAATPALEAQELTPPAGTYYKKVAVAATPLDAAQTVTAGTSAKTVNPAAGNLGIKAVTVNPTPSSAKTITPTKDTQTVNPDSGKLLSSVTVNPIPEAYIIPAGTKNITANGTADVTSFAEVNVAVPAPDLSDATATPAKILLGATAYIGAGKITGTIPTYNGLIRPEMPNKGDIITMDAKQYRVLKTEGSVAEVLCMYDANNSIKFDSASSGYNNTYAGKNIDIYCNNTFYNSLSATMKSAIVDKTFTQDSWERMISAPTESHYTGKYGPFTYYLTLVNAAYGSSITRHCYCLSVQDVLDYLEATTSMGESDTTLTDKNIWQMFWNVTTSQSDKYIWLRSASSSHSDYEFVVYGSSGDLADLNLQYASAARPAFQIDLSKISWSK